MTNQTDEMVFLRVSTPKFVYPRPLNDVGDETAIETRPHDPLADNGIVLSHVIGGSAAEASNEVRCFNDVQDPSATGERPAASQADSQFLLLRPFFQSNGGAMPASTEICCWWDCNKFDTPPICAPFTYKQTDDSFGGCGCFCSFACALAWLQDKPSCHRYIPLLRFLRQKQSDVLITSPLIPAPPREMLQMFGGGLTLDQFRDVTSHNGMRMVHMPNMHPLRMNVENRAMTVVESSSVLKYLKDMKRFQLAQKDGSAPKTLQ